MNRGRMVQIQRREQGRLNCQSTYN
jgi:hypothetical protein